MQKDLDENSYEKRIENIEKGKSYLKSNGFFRLKTNLFKFFFFLCVILLKERFNQFKINFLNYLL